MPELQGRNRRPEHPLGSEHGDLRGYLSDHSAPRRRRLVPALQRSQPAAPALGRDISIMCRLPRRPVLAQEALARQATVRAGVPRRETI